MKVIIINGSARKGNTLTAINAFAKGVSDNHELEVVDTYKLMFAPCIGCGACEYLCPSRPYSAIYVEGHEMHRSI